MAYVIPSDAHIVGDPNHTPDHDNICDVLGLLATILAQSGGGPAGVNVLPPGGNATAITALQAQQAWTSHFGLGPGYYPYQFPVQAYGATGNGKQFTDGVMTNGSAILTSNTANFAAADVGKLIIVNQGAQAAQANPVCTTIASWQSSTQVTLSANCTVNGTTSAPFIFGTDDATAIVNCVNAAAAWATSTGNNKVQVIFESCIYMLGALTQTTSPCTYNTHIPIPFATQFSNKMVIDLIGVGDASEPDYWESTIPSLSGTCLVSASFMTTVSGTFGQQSIIGGPTSSTGLGPGNFANVLVNVSGITIAAPFNAGQIGYDFRQLAQANVPNASYLGYAAVNFSGQPISGPTLTSTALVTNGNSVGLIMPIPANNDNCNVGFFTCEGATVGIAFSEHFTAQRLAIIYCVTGIYAGYLTGSSVIHGGSILYASVEASGTSLYCNGSSGGQYPIFIGQLDTEVIGTADIADAANCLTGTVYWADFERTTMTVTGATSLNIVNTRLPPGPWAGAPAAPTQAVAQQNTAYRPAFIKVTSTAAITATATGPTSGTMTTVTESAVIGAAVGIRVPSGHWYSVTSAGGTLTTKWVLE